MEIDRNEREFRFPHKEAEWRNVDDNSFTPVIDISSNVDEENLKQQEKTRYAQNTRQRKSLAKWVVWTCSGWLGGVLSVLVLCGLGILHLSDMVLNALLVTTTANVLGLAYIVLRAIFNDRASDDKSNHN